MRKGFSGIRSFFRTVRQDRETGITHRPDSSVKTVRLGGGGGAWIIPADLGSPNPICYCAGAGEDISFDTLLAEKYGANVWVIDPTPRAIRHYEELRERTFLDRKWMINGDPSREYSVGAEAMRRISYLAIGLWTTNETMKFFAPANDAHVSHSIVNLQRTDSWFEANVRRLKSVMIELGHDRVDLLKLDIEGAEYEVLDTIIEDNLDVRAICVEYDEWHHRIDDGFLDRINGSMQRMKDAGYLMAHLDLTSECTVLYTRKGARR